MVDGTPESAAGFYQWANERYRRRVAGIAWALVATIIIAVLIMVLLLQDLRELREENRTTNGVVSALQNDVDELSVQLRKADKRSLSLIRCINSRDARFQEGMRKLIRGQITTVRFLARYKSVVCK